MRHRITMLEFEAPFPRSALPSRAARATRAVARAPRRLGFLFSLLLVYLFFEFGRPAHPLGIPMIVSVLLFAGWLASERTGRPPALPVLCFFGLVALMFLGVPLALNAHAAFWTAYGMAILLLCICIPMTRFVTSIQHVRVWLYSFVAIAAYVAVYAVTHEGFGPAGAGGAQDENYVAALMGMAVPCAYFGFQAERRRVAKAVLAASLLLFCLAIVVSFSRGGFIGLCAVLVYCLARSRRKLIGFAVMGLMVLTLVAMAGHSYWDEMATITDVNESTADLRLEVWRIGLRMFAASPVLGVGAGNFRWAVGDYQSLDQSEKYGRSLGGSIIAHSLFVELLAELGAAGVCLVAVSLVSTYKGLKQTRRLARGRGDAAALRHYADAAAGSIIACLINGVFLSLLYFSHLWLFIALAVAMRQIAVEHLPPRESRR
jgi:putative inorganic carbon (hco3(-)) transporter